MNNLRKTKKEYKKIKEIGNLRKSYQKELHKVFFQHYMVYSDYNDLPKRAASDKVLLDKAFEFAKNLKDDGYQRSLASMI